MPLILVRPVSVVGKVIDGCLGPVMRVLSGDSDEAPQRTHRWNYHKLASSRVKFLDAEMMVKHAGLKGEQLCGDWRHYVVVRPMSWPASLWHIGWITAGNVGVTRLELHGEVRVLIGPDPVSFFGVTTVDPHGTRISGRQIPLVKVGEGVIGDGGPFRNIPLL